MEDAYTLFLPKSQFEQFYLCFCGKSTCEGGHSFGPHVRQVYLVHYITKGKGIYKVGNRTYHLEKGQGFVIEPGTLTYYEADIKDPWQYVWIAFAGEKAKEYVESVGLGNEKLVYSTEYGHELRDHVDMMLTLNKNTVSNQFMLQSLLCSFFEVLARSKATAPEMKSDHENSYVQQAINYIESNFATDITIQKIADFINIDRSYLFYLFKQERGCSPQQYLMDYRISFAKEMLIETDYSVETICYSCGYKNPETFTKAFKKHVGKAPGQFRKHERKFHEDQLNKIRENK